ncbi:hypothetical protein EVAR_45596_1 [Eumeta japonica]|uniref:Uncharacterized protein n=1 Tax=Eumeta variegata TaxID=151549 RepID=A0A4C1YWN0_EUMVA|nr:hypothetical protein EVAR_45596_1 [Eumeta japonica]
MLFHINVTVDTGEGWYFGNHVTFAVFYINFFFVYLHQSKFVQTLSAPTQPFPYVASYVAIVRARYKLARAARADHGRGACSAARRRVRSYSCK